MGRQKRVPDPFHNHFSFPVFQGFLFHFLELPSDQQEVHVVFSLLLLASTPLLDGLAPLLEHGVVLVAADDLAFQIVVVAGGAVVVLDVVVV